MSRTAIARATLLMLGVMAALVLSVSSSASAAAPLGCSTATKRGADAETLQYSFRCSDSIIGYVLTFDQEIQGFDTEVPVLDEKGAATDALFSCEGGFPAFGVGCFGVASRGGLRLTGNVSLDRDACTEPRYHGWLTVITSEKGQSSGPFVLHGPKGCAKKSGPIKRLLAWIELLKASKK